MSTMQTTPNWVWLLLVGAVFGVSSAGAIFQQVDDVPPLLRASWRLQLTSLVLAPLALIQWYSHGHKIKHRFCVINVNSFCQFIYSKGRIRV